MVALDCLAYTYYAWDEDENVVAGGVEPNLMPLTTQEVSIDSLALPDASGWIQLLWPRSNTDAADLYQSWVVVKSGRYGTYSGAANASIVGNFNCRTGSEVFRSGFERGAPSAWTQSVP
jgi:hypothetical protein